MRIAPQEHPLQSCLYHGQVTHTRHAPFRHTFRYGLFMAYLDLSELDAVFRTRWLWSARCPNVAWFRRADHFGSPDRPLDVCVRQLVREQIGREPTGPIRLLTLLRHFGVRMNPVSLYFCYDASGSQVEAMVAEVTNTPWGEQHCYVIPWNSGRDDVMTTTHAKRFHVSPFMPMEMTYQWRVTRPRETLLVHIANHRAGQCVFDATLSLRRRPITSLNLARTLAQHPLMTVKVTTAIYWQALRLWWRDAAFHPHPRHADPTESGRRAGSAAESVTHHHVEEITAS